jgi:hypothetical protein
MAVVRVTTRLGAAAVKGLTVEQHVRRKLVPESAPIEEAVTKQLGNAFAKSPMKAFHARLLDAQMIVTMVGGVMKLLVSVYARKDSLEILACLQPAAQIINTTLQRPTGTHNGTNLVGLHAQTDRPCMDCFAQTVMHYRVLILANVQHPARVRATQQL